MPYVEGETVRDKLNRETQLGIDEAVKITVEVAEALEYAHQQGVIHRDIKPENILLHAGRPLVADFGIALAVSAAADGRMTETGLSLGTPHYMSPEQATAEKDLTNRSDIYSLATVLYEMLTGEPPHLGNSAQQIIMKIVTDEARPVTELRKAVPPHVAAATAKSLEKLAADRFASAAQFADALSNPAFTLRTAETTTVAGARTRGPWNRLSVGLAVAMAVVAAVAVWGWQRPTSGRRVAKFVVALPAEQHLVTNHDNLSIAISPDGSRLSYVGAGDGERQLYVREMSELEARAIPGTERARDPFFSPDGQWIGFFSDAQLKKVAVDGGPPIELAAAPDGRGGSWTNDEMIVFAHNTTHGLSRVSASGGTLESISQPNADSAELSHRWPHVLPGGKAVLFTIWNGSTTTATLAALLLEGGEVQYLVRGAARGLYVRTGHLVYVDAAGTMLAAPFNLGKLEITGSTVSLAEDVLVKLGTSAAEFSIAPTGVLVYLRGLNEEMLVLVDRQGNERQLEGRLRWPDAPRFSPDGSQIALTVDERGDSDVWVYDVARSAIRRLTFEGNNTYPEWSPDGRWIGFSSVREGSDGRDLYQKRADGTAQAELLLSAKLDQWELVWSAEDRLVYRETHPETSRDLWTVNLSGDGERQPFLRTPADEQTASISPDGRWIAYTSDETGQTEVYVQALPDPRGPWQVSANGGTEPRWGPRGRVIYYRRGSKLLRVAVAAGESFAVSPPTVLFGGEYSENLNHAAYDVHPDGNQFVMIRGVPGSVALAIVQNFFEELRAKVGN
jgi:serine/threonine-protein kinase